MDRSKKPIDMYISVGRWFLLALAALAISLAGMSDSQAQPSETTIAPSLTFGVRSSYYLTDAKVQGDAALFACDAGYHMASIWEIADPTNLRYDTVRGAATADSGQGPPTGAGSEYVGWVRTGYSSDTGSFAGRANCGAWTSAAGADNGTAVLLSNDWASSGGDIGPWQAGITSCGGSWRVWCVRPVEQVFLPLVLRSA